MDRALRTGQWRRNPLPIGTDLSGKICGIVGMGEIGRAMASLVLDNLRAFLSDQPVLTGEV